MFRSRERQNKELKGKFAADAQAELSSDAVGSVIFEGGIKLSLSRPLAEQKSKWDKYKNQMGVRLLSTPEANRRRFAEYLKTRGPIALDINSEGQIVNAVADGNTRLYGAVALGLKPSEVPILFRLPNGDQVSGNLEMAITAAKQVRFAITKDSTRQDAESAAALRAFLSKK